MSLATKKQQAVSYLKESLPYVYIATGIFSLFVILGFTLQSHLTFLDKIIGGLVSKVALLHGLDVGLYIFANNSQAAFTGLVTGVLFGIVPVLNLVMNGTVVGYVFARVAHEVGAGQIWKILPHGVFELPAVFISLGLGIRLGMFVFTKNPFKTLRERLYYSLLVFILIVVPLLAIAACIEGMLIDVFE